MFEKLQTVFSIDDLYDMLEIQNVGDSWRNAQRRNQVDGR